MTAAFLGFKHLYLNLARWTAPALLVVVIFLFLLPQSVSAGAVSITLPNGGECLTVGVSYDVTASFDTNHSAIYYKNDGTQPIHLDSSLIKHPLRKLFYKWTPGSGDISETGRIWIEGHLTNHASTGDWDVSDADFAVRGNCGGDGGGDGGGISGGGGPAAYHPEVAITAPLRGDVFGTIVPITYEATDKNDEFERAWLGLSNSSVSIYYIVGSDIRRRNFIVGGLTATGTYNWNAEGLPEGDDYRVIVRAVDNVGEKGEAVSPAFSIDYAVPSIDVYATGAVIRWQTDNSAYSFVEHGTTSKEYTSTTLSSYPNLAIEQYALLQNLTASTTYYFRTVIGATLDEKIRSLEYSFTTLVPENTTRPIPPNGVFGAGGETTALLSWRLPTDVNYLETVIVRRIDRFAKHVKDGNEINISTSTLPYYRDSALKLDTKYYYSVFHINTNRDISLPVAISITTKRGVEELPLPMGGENTSTLSRIHSPSVVAGESSVMIRWTNPDNQNFVGVHIVRNDESLPGNPFDGDTVFRGRTESTIDSGLISDTAYFYGLFAFDWENLFSPAAFISAKTTIPFVPLVIGVATTTATTTPSILVSATNSPSQIFEENLGGQATEGMDSEELAISTNIKAITIQNLIDGVNTEIQKLMDKIEKMSLQTKLNVKGEVHTIRIDTDGFSPQNITIASGDTILWINDGLEFAWPASDLHPTHSLHPTTGGCSHSGFDVCRGMKIGEEFSFTFNEPGAFGYHDHTFPAFEGKIIVTE